MGDKKQIVLIAVLSLLVGILCGFLLKASLLFGNYRSFSPDGVMFDLMGEAWLDGIPPYASYFDHKGPVIFAYYAFSHILVNKGHLGMNILYSLMMDVSAFLCFVYFMKHKLFQNFKQNVATSMFVIVLAFTIWHLFMYFLGIAIQELLLPFFMGCMLIWSKWVEDEKISYKMHFAYGVFCGVISLSRPTDALLPVFLYAFYWFYAVFHKKAVRGCIMGVIAVIFGVLLPCFVTSVYFYSHGLFYDFMNAWIFENLHYVDASGWSTKGIFVLIVFFILLFMLFGFVLYLWRHKKATVADAVTVSSLFVYAFVMMLCRISIVYMLFPFACMLLSGWSIFKRLISTSWADGSVGKMFMQVFTGIVFMIIVLWSVSDFYGLHAMAETNRLSNENSEKYISMLESYGDYMIIDGSWTAGVSAEKRKLPVGRYVMFQSWYMSHGVLTVDDIKSDIDGTKPDAIFYYHSDNEKVQGVYNARDVLFRDYDMVMKTHADYDPEDCYSYIFVRKNLDK